MTSRSAGPAQRTRRPATDEELKALASTLRTRILRVCREAHTNKEIAETLARDPATILHHVRKLVDTGFLAAQSVRRGSRGSREIPYLATGKSWILDCPPRDRVLLDAFLEEVGQVPVTEVHTTRLGLRLSAAQKDELEQRLQGLLDEFADLPDDPAAPAWSIFLAVHPDPNRP